MPNWLWLVIIAWLALALIGSWGLSRWFKFLKHWDSTQYTQRHKEHDTRDGRDLPHDD